MPAHLKNMYYILLVYILLCNVYIARSIIVNTTSGLIMGKVVKDETVGVIYKAFEGIPYAEPPLGDLRFKAPISVKPWTDIYNATTAGHACPQINVLELKEEMSENCLFLNIFTPIFSNKLLPVIIFVHGGNFRYGSANPNDTYGPQLMLKRNIIVATMNYRLGPLGFLSLQSEDASGNAGLKDVLLAVEWISSNIKRFGGDPEQVTIGGQSSGAVLAQYLMINQKSDGLFQRAILMSGNILSFKFIQTNSTDNARSLGKKLGLTWTDDDNLLQQLKKVEVSAIVAAENEMTKENPRRGIQVYTPFAPCIEKNTTTAIIKEAPLDSIKAGKLRNISCLIGIVNQEGLEVFPNIKINENAIDKINKNFELCIPPDIDYPIGSVMSEKLAMSIRERYFYNGNISIFNTQNYINYISDSEFVYSTDYFVELLQDQKYCAPLYYYVFEFDGQMNIFKLSENITYPGAAHGDDLGYIFLSAPFKPIFTKMDTRTKRVLTNTNVFFSNFIKYGNPTPKRGFNGVLWPEATKSRRHLVIDYHPRVVWHAPFPTRTEFWREVYEEHDEYKDYIETLNI